MRHSLPLFLNHTVKAIIPARTRFAPSPTGHLHLGGLRTALFNYFLARRTGGSFLLRIEDTDRSRYVEGAAERLLGMLKWAGISIDEGFGVGGQESPYVQSERTEIYREHLGRLVEGGHAYRCFCEPGRLKVLRDEAVRAGTGGGYDRRCLELSRGEVEERLRMGVPHVVRLLSPDNPIKVDDIVHGSVEFGTQAHDDTILLKSDGYPTYHLASVVDDHLMRITHVLRGDASIYLHFALSLHSLPLSLQFLSSLQEWLSSTPKHIHLYHAFGWPAPRFAHLPLLLNEDRSKLSKRSGDVFVEDYVAKGYLPEAVVNFVSLLGWNPGSGKEFFTMDELEREFSLEKLSKSATVVGNVKLGWVNKHHLLARTESADGVASLVKILKPLVMERFGGKACEKRLREDYLERVIGTMKERIRTINDISNLCGYFFIAPDLDTEEARKLRSKLDNGVLVATVRDCSAGFAALKEFTESPIRVVIDAVAERAGTNRNAMLIALRYAVTGTKVGASMTETMEILGRDECLERLRVAAEKEGL